MKASETEIRPGQKVRFPLRSMAMSPSLKVEANRIVDVEGIVPTAQRLRVGFAEEPAQGNIAELAFGCNPNAVVWGNVLEDEKAGFHWAFGRSEHLGGTVGPEAFSSPDRVVRGRPSLRRQADCRS